MNPQHTVPVLDDNGAIIWDSHAICTYLISRYAPDDSLYPKDLVKRAHIDQRLHFDSGVLFSAIRNANMVVYLGGSEVPKEKIDGLHSALELLETFLTDSQYLVGNQLTVADLACLTTVTAFELHFSIEANRYPNIAAWLKRLSTLSYYDELITKPNIELKSWFEEKKQANAAANNN